MIPIASYIADTVTFVAHAHGHQRYGDHPNPGGPEGVPYVEHALEVARRLRGHGLHAVLAGLLHDTVEDTYVTEDVLRERGYPEEVIAGVMAVTRRDDEEYPDLIRRAASHPLGCYVKLADNLANTDNLPALVNRQRAARLERKYARARQILREPYTRLQMQAHQAGLDHLQFGPEVPCEVVW